MNTCNYFTTISHSKTATAIPRVSTSVSSNFFQYFSSQFPPPHVRVLIDLIKSKERENAGSFLPLQPPFGNDSMSAWERGDTGGTGSEKVNAGAPVRISLATVSKHRAGSKNFWYLLCLWCH